MRLSVLNYPILGESGVHLKVEYSNYLKKISKSFFHLDLHLSDVFSFGEFSQNKFRKFARNS